MKETSGDLFLNNMTINVDMFCLFMKCGIVTNVDGCLIVAI